ncbi:MAG TPA: hypothetical protein VIM51_09415 [Desulfosporosinus sp.]
MLAWIPVLIIMGFLGGCAAVVITSSYQLIKSLSRIPGKRGPLARTVEV